MRAHARHACATLRNGMRPILALAILGPLACGHAPPGDSRARPESASAPLDCSRGDCRSLDDEIAHQCELSGTTVSRATNGRYTVVVAQTDPESYVHTKMTFVFDERGALVGRASFVSEYARWSTEGVVPRGDNGPFVDACTR